MCLRSELFIQSSRKLFPQLGEVSDQELRMQFNLFLMQLEDHIEDDLKSIAIFKDLLYRLYCSEES